MFQYNSARCRDDDCQGIPQFPSSNDIIMRGNSFSTNCSPLMHALTPLHPNSTNYITRWLHTVYRSILQLFARCSVLLYCWRINWLLNVCSSRTFLSSKESNRHTVVSLSTLCIWWQCSHTLYSASNGVVNSDSVFSLALPGKLALWDRGFTLPFAFHPKIHKLKECHTHMCKTFCTNTRECLNSMWWRACLINVRASLQ